MDNRRSQPAPTTIASALLAAFLALGVLTATGCESAASGTHASAASETNRREIVVYVTRTGAKYHRGTCQHLARSKIPMSLAEAKKVYGPCKTCRPPV